MVNAPRSWITRLWRVISGSAPAVDSISQHVPKPLGTFQVSVSCDRGTAQRAAGTPGVLGLFVAAEKQKWAYLLCPCGCGQQLALNLMKSQWPYWRVEVRGESDFSVYPSVRSATCGAHFWLDRNTVTWCE